MSAGTDKETYLVGDGVRLRSVVRRNNTPVLNAIVNARITDRSGSKILRLYDDGSHGDEVPNDGQYMTNQYLAATVSEVTYTVTAASGVFQRQEDRSFVVTGNTSTMNGTFFSKGIDSNGDGLFDELAIDVITNFKQAGKYSIGGTLVDARGTMIDMAFAEKTLAAPDKGVITLKFDGETIAAYGINGPYYLKNLFFDYRQGDSKASLGFLKDAHTTARYSYLSFQHPLIQLGSNSVDTAVDTDSDGLYNSLIVNLAVNVANAGQYDVTGRLDTANGQKIDWSSALVDLNAGANMVQLVFPGMRVRQSGKDGPYLSCFAHFFSHF